MSRDTRQWEVRSFQSGTVIVIRDEKSPHYYVYGPRSDQEDAMSRDRHAVAKDLCAHLNGGPRPRWLDDMKRVSETRADGLDGTLIMVTGPSVDRDPPNLDWVEDPSPHAQAGRAQLMDRLLII